ncbi:hypothetical protein [Aquipuribacter hungaricus]|uniref:MinD-like ATPase involved in chromosome partitioning or flagellar assembly n=1 Tax=Aquipuribacter hungaricus TaxID=545624 RepID=A0ABV7WBY9_9MICO
MSATTTTRTTTALPSRDGAGAEPRPRPAVSVPELRRAWAAVQAGAFRAGGASNSDPAQTSAAGSTGTWSKTAGERVLPVLGCSGACGASTVAVAVATAALNAAATAPVGPVRVVECSPPAASGVAAASTSELGWDPSGWVRGQRGDLLLERVAEDVDAADQVPTPAVLPVSASPASLATVEGAGALSVLDVGWGLQHVLARPSWLQDEVLMAEHAVLVTTATVPGLRRLEVQLDLLSGVGCTVHAAVIGPRRRRWSRAVAHGLGPHTRALDDDGRLVEVPHDRELAVLGLSPAPLPPALLQAAARLLAPTTTRGVTP